MGILRKSLYLAAAALMVASCGGAGPIAAKPTPDPIGGTYVTKGGGGALDVVKALTTGFSTAHPTVVWQGFDDVGSDAAVKLAADGSVDLGYISRDLKAPEKGTVETLPVGASGTGVGVNASNTVKALTKDQVAKIFSGQITDWKDVGGNPGKIRVLLREPGSATRSAFESYFFGSAKPTYAKDAIEVLEIDETLKAIGSFKESIGMMTMNAKTFGTADVRLLTVDNIAATRETLANGTYPIRRPLYLVYNTDPAKLKPAIKAFLDFVKGPEGQKILAGL
ncbi:MAG TPA: substrate-binding domain-containing protein [Candidatus Limnocylindria bacterium]|jgi:phosphate transport system substrate-binding protein|nr:substrate-binding domain-containing protein [Candidatus Limnocylindria bacterium]